MVIAADLVKKSLRAAMKDTHRPDTDSVSMENLWATVNRDRDGNPTFREYCPVDLTSKELLETDNLNKSLDQLTTLIPKLLAAVMIIVAVGTAYERYRRIRTRFLLVGLLMRFLSPKSSTAIMGDLQEGFGALRIRKGHKTASKWFWREATKTVLSLSFDALKRFSGLERLFRRIGS